MLLNRVVQRVVQCVIQCVVERVVRKLESDGLLMPDPEQPWLDFGLHEPIDSLSAASIRYRIAIGPHSGSRTLTLHDPSFIRTDKSTKALTAVWDGFHSTPPYLVKHISGISWNVFAGTSQDLLFA